MLKGIHLFTLYLIKAMYGLVDAPLLWQLAIIYTLTKVLGFWKSHWDENCLYLFENGEVTFIIILHVDDLLAVASREYLDWFVWEIEKEYGKLKRQAMPFVYLGIHHERIGWNRIFLSQIHYLEKIPSVAVDPQRAKQPKLAALMQMGVMPNQPIDLVAIQDALKISLA